MILIHHILLNIGTLSNAKSLPTSLNARSNQCNNILLFYTNIFRGKQTTFLKSRCTENRYHDAAQQKSEKVSKV